MGSDLNILNCMQILQNSHGLRILVRHTNSMQLLITIGYVQNKVQILARHSSLTTPQDGFTPLMKASQGGHLSVVRTLLQAGATVNTTNHVRYT